MIDSYRLVHGDAKTGYSRMAHTIHASLDRTYTQTHNSVWRWQKVHSPPDTFTGNAASDHLPVIVRLVLAKERPPCATEAKNNPAIFESPNTRLITKLLRTKHFEKFPPQEHEHARAWEAAKTAVATYLLYETKELRIKDSPITKLKKHYPHHTRCPQQAGPFPHPYRQNKPLAP
jgi:hypothetical protein